MRTLVIDNDTKMSFVSAGNFICQSPWKHARRIIDSFEFILVMEGTLSLAANGTSYTLKKGETLLLFPGEEHYGERENRVGLSFFWLHFVFSGKQPEVEERNVRIPEATCIMEHTFLSDSDQLAICFRLLLSYLPKKQQIPLDLLTRLVLYEASEAGQETSYDTNLQEVLSYMLANKTSAITVNAIASKFGYNPKYFITLFRRKEGVTPKQFLLRQKIEHSKILLSTTNLRIKEIADKLSFSDDKKFCKCFRKVEGITPTQYRIRMSSTHFNIL